MAKAKSGTVVTQSFQGRLRLVWSYQGKRYFLTLGLIDNTINKLLAQQTASHLVHKARIKRGYCEVILNTY